MTKEQECTKHQYHLAAALYMDTPLFSKIGHNEHFAVPAQVAAIESRTKTNNRS